MLCRGFFSTPAQPLPAPSASYAHNEHSSNEKGCRMKAAILIRVNPEFGREGYLILRLSTVTVPRVIVRLPEITVGWVPTVKFTP